MTLKEKFPTLRDRRSRRLVALVVLGYLLLCAYFTTWSYFQTCDEVAARALFRLEGIVNAAALQIDGDEHRYLSHTYRLKDAVLYNAQDTHYAKIHHVLARNADANMLQSPIYTLVYDTLQQSYAFIATSAETPYFRHRYDSFHPILAQNFEKGGTIPMYTDGFGMWLSAFAPIRDSRGHPVAVLMADERFDAVIMEARKHALTNLSVALLIVLPFVAVVVFFVRRMVLRDARMQHQLAEISAALERSYDQLSASNDVRKEMMAHISHDLRTPLTNLSGYLETVIEQKNTISEENRSKFLNIALKETERLRKLIDALFDLSKLEAQQMPLQPEALALAELLQDVTHKYSSICQQKNIDCVLKLDPSLPWVWADIKLIDRVLQNLLDNAIRYNCPTASGQRFIHISATTVGERVEIIVENSAEKLPPSVLTHIFERYVKHHDVEGSTGLGLAIVAKIVALHQGQIDVENTEDCMRFRFDLPQYLGQ